MTCDEFQSLLDNYENLSDDEKLNMTLHTAECESCRSDLDFMLSIINVTKNLPPVKAPDNFISELNKRIDLEEMKQKRRIAFVRRAFSDWKRYGAVAACLLIAVVVGFNGKSLVFDMTNRNTGFVIEETTTSVGVDNVSTPEATPIISEVPVTPSTPETVKSTVTESQKPDKKVAAAVKTTTPTAKPVVSPSITAKPSNTVNPVSAETSKSEVKEPTVEIKTQPTPTAVAEPAVITETPATEAPYTLQRDGYHVSEEEPVAVASAQATPANDIAKGYSVASTKEQLALGVYTPIDRNGNPTDYDVNTGGVIADSPTVDSILVSSEDEAVVRDLISRYITGNYGMYYMSTEDKLNKFFEELDKAGISYEKFLHSSTNKISFKLVIIS